MTTHTPQLCFGAIAYAELNVKLHRNYSNKPNTDQSLTEQQEKQLATFLWKSSRQGHNLPSLKDDIFSKMSSEKGIHIPAISAKPIVKNILQNHPQALLDEKEDKLRYIYHPVVCTISFQAVQKESITEVIKDITDPDKPLSVELNSYNSCLRIKTGSDADSTVSRKESGLKIAK